MTNNLSSSNLILLIVSIILMVIIVGCAAIIIILRIKKRKNNHQPEFDDIRLQALDKEIRRYKKLQEKYKNKIIQKQYVDHTKALQDMKVILDSEIKQYKSQELSRVNEEIQKHRNEILKKVILVAMQPIHLKVINESSVHYLPIDEANKPLIIGKKGRNIKHLNEITNCNINVSKESQYIEISCPNPLDKQIAINTINHMLKSQAFDITAINNVYAKECRLIAKECYETGKEYLNKIQFKNLDPTLCEYVGRLKYRWSFSQNVLQHCYETALICENLAKELGLNPQTAKEVGFFHDIGKSMDYESQYNHISTGVKIAKEANLSQDIINGILKHHRNNCYDDYVLLVRCADAWSAARAGARHVPTEKQEEAIKIVENKLKKINGLLSYKVDIEDNTIKIVFVPSIPDKKSYLDRKYEIIKAVKSDIRLNKHYSVIVH